MNIFIICDLIFFEGKVDKLKALKFFPILLIFYLLFYI